MDSPASQDVPVSFHTAEESLLADNPLLVPSSLPYGAPALDRIKPEHFEPAMKRIVAGVKGDLEAIKRESRSSGVKTLEGVADAYEDLCQMKDMADRLYQGLLTPAMKQASNAVSTLFAEAEVALFSDKALYDKVKGVAENDAGLAWNEKLLAERLLTRFEKTGVHLAPAQKERLAAIRGELATLANQFKENNGKRDFQIPVADAQELSGVSRKTLEQLQANAKERNASSAYVITAKDYPTVVATCENRAMREKVYRARMGLCFKDGTDNTNIALKILSLRQEMAEMNGFENFAAYTLRDFVLAKNVDEVLQGQEQIRQRIYSAAEARFRAMEALAHSEGMEGKLERWDVPMYRAKLLAKEASGDADSMQDYQGTFESVLGAFNDYIGATQGLELKKADGEVPVYRSDMRVYEVVRKETGEVLGLQYFDLFADENGRKETCSQVFKNGGRHHGQRELPLVVNYHDFSKPDAEGKIVLSPYEAELTFHELGHSLSVFCANAGYPLNGMNGIEEVYDPAEMQSQLAAHRLYGNDLLKQIFHRKETGEALPDALCERLRADRAAKYPEVAMYSVYLSEIDICAHSGAPKSLDALASMEKEIGERTLYTRYENSLELSQFAHIMNLGVQGQYFLYGLTDEYARRIDAAIQNQDRSSPAIQHNLQALYGEREPGRFNEALQALVGDGPRAPGLKPSAAPPPTVH